MSGKGSFGHWLPIFLAPAMLSPVVFFVNSPITKALQNVNGNVWIGSVIFYLFAAAFFYNWNEGSRGSGLVSLSIGLMVVLVIANAVIFYFVAFAGCVSKLSKMGKPAP
jgi:hypothetical protein